MTDPTAVSVTPLWRGSDIDENRDPKTSCWLVAEALRNPPLMVTLAQRDALTPPVTRTTLGHCQGGDRVYLEDITNQHELQLYEVVPA